MGMRHLSVTVWEWTSACFALCCQKCLVLSRVLTLVPCFIAACQQLILLPKTFLSTAALYCDVHEIREIFTRNSVWLDLTVNGTSGWRKVALKVTDSRGTHAHAHRGLYVRRTFNHFQPKLIGTEELLSQPILSFISNESKIWTAWFHPSH
jgi:hypothetical protein